MVFISQVSDLKSKGNNWCEMYACDLIKMWLNRQNLGGGKATDFVNFTIDLINCKSLALTPVILFFFLFAFFFHPVKIKL